jgi:hypothetical protein
MHFIYIIGTRTDNLVPLSAPPSISSLPPINSARSFIPSRPKCPLGAKSVGLWGRLKPIPLSLTSRINSCLLKLILSVTWLLLAQFDIVPVQLHVPAFVPDPPAENLPAWFWFRVPAFRAQWPGRDPQDRSDARRG